MVYIILGRGFEEIEAVAPADILRRGGVEVCYAAVGENLRVEGAHGIAIEAQERIGSISPAGGDYVVIPGGMGGVNSIKGDSEAMAVLKAAAENGARLSAICAGPSVLAELGLLEGRTITCYPGNEKMMGGARCDTSVSVKVDGSLITGRAPGSAIDFGLALLAAIAGEAKAAEIRSGLVY
jgi:4-methyl-5(b-hydroxyethyl)-thiazole monophosphate biosynthesis